MIPDDTDDFGQCEALESTLDQDGGINCVKGCFDHYLLIDQLCYDVQQDRKVDGQDFSKQSKIVVM